MTIQKKLQSKSPKKKGRSNFLYAQNGIVIDGRWFLICFSPAIAAGGLVGGYQIGFYSLNHQHKPLGNHALNRLSQDIIQIWQQIEIIPNGSFASCLSYDKIFGPGHSLREMNLVNFQLRTSSTPEYWAILEEENGTESFHSVCFWSADFFAFANAIGRPRSRKLVRSFNLLYLKR